MSFKTYHPIVNFIYFCAVIMFSMFFMHPVFLGISFICSLLYSVMLNGGKAIKFNIIYMLPLMLFAAIINPAFNHDGITILFYLPSGNPVTLESIAYGIAAAVMLVSVIMWFSCYNSVVTSDKLMCLFGKIIPALSLIFSMVLRFVPKFKAQFKVIFNAQRCIGRNTSKIKNIIKIISIMITWALENSIDTADSMNSRGYGLHGRTSFSNYRFDGRDTFAVIYMLALIGAIITGAYSGFLDVRFFPSVKAAGLSPFYAAYLLLCLFPVIIDITEEIKWKYLISKI